MIEKIEKNATGIMSSLILNWFCFAIYVLYEQIDFARGNSWIQEHFFDFDNILNMILNVAQFAVIGFIPLIISFLILNGIFNKNHSNIKGYIIIPIISNFISIILVFFFLLFMLSLS